ncbi:MAG: hypothetical protein ACR2KG_08925 [Nocardioidaceae bacterium]
MFVWVGSFLINGDFFQSGTTTRYPGCETQMSEFAQAYMPDGSEIFGVDVACGVTIPTYAPFAIYQVGYAGGGFYTWQASGETGVLPGTTFNVKDVSLGKNTPLSVAELNSTTPISVYSQLGPVGADPALQTRLTSDQPWVDTLSAEAYYEFAAHCPPTNVFAHGNNWIPMGTGLNHSCSIDGGFLW